MKNEPLSFSVDFSAAQWTLNAHTGLETLYANAGGNAAEVLGRYGNAGFNAYKRGDRAEAAAYFRQGLEHAETFLAAGETTAGVREEVLGLYDKAGFNAYKRGDRAATADYLRQGLEHAETFLAAGETAAGVREHVLRLYFNAGVNAGKRGDRAAAAAYCRQGLEHAETFLAAVALTGLTIDAPSEQWTEETADGLHQELQSSLNPMPPPDTPWPPLQYWLRRVSQVIPPLPDVATCQHRLQADEALAQLFFDPNTGDLKALWLTQGHALRRRCFPAASRYAGWSASDGEDGILARWVGWFQQGEHTDALQELWPSVMDSAPVRSVAASLSEWARQAGVQRLCILFPAELAQLPWEALDVFDPERLILERAVSLTHWRVTPTAPPESEEPVPPATIAYAHRDGSVAYGRREAERAGAYWHSPVGQTATAFDVMAQLQQGPNGHLIMHGRYVAHNPYISYLKLSATDHLYAWTFGALDLQGHLGLSACQATLSGQQAEHLLGPVGLGPALIAAGAKRVIGPLWNCDQLASWLFHRFLFQAAETRPERPWTCHLAQARRQLRAMTAAELRTFLQQHLDKPFREPDFDYLTSEERPFANPYYWAPFVVLGDDRP